MPTIQNDHDREIESDLPQGMSGWLALTQNSSVPKIIDALLDVPARREFNKSELAERADVSRNSVRTHKDLLLGLGIIDAVPDTNPQRYRLNTDSEIVAKLYELDSAVGAELRRADI